MLSCGFLCGCSNDDDDFYEINVGATLSEFAVYDDSNEMVFSKDFKGSGGVIVFFNTDCPDCRKELEVVQQVYEKCQEEENNIRFLCISRNQDLSSVASYWRKNNLTIPYSGQSDNKIYLLFASSIIPRIYIVSPSLVITHSFTEDTTYEKLMEAIKSTKTINSI